MDIHPCTNELLNEAASVLANEYFASLEDAKKHVRQSIQNNTCLCASQDGEIVGVLTYLRDYSHWANYLDYIMVAPESRRQGVARKLIDEWIGICRKEQPAKQKYALSSTDVTNEASINMHENLASLSSEESRNCTTARMKFFTVIYCTKQQKILTVRYLDRRKCDHYFLHEYENTTDSTAGNIY